MHIHAPFQQNRHSMIPVMDAMNLLLILLGILVALLTGPIHLD